MTLTPLWRTRFIAASASLFAVWTAAQLAQGEYLLAGVTAGFLFLYVLAKIQPYPLHTILLVGAMVGYVIGNRGFAQISIAPSFPLLPAEAVLLVAGMWLLVRSALRREMPLRSDALDLILLGWIIICSLRVFVDVREYGALALRDFALVYYAAFYYLGRDMAADPASRRLYLRIFAVSSLIVLPAFWLFDAYPHFFIGTLTVQGVPLIFYKGDLAVTFIAAGALLFFLRYEQRLGAWNLLISLLLAAAVLSMNSRAAILGLALVAVWLALCGRWRFAAALGAGGALSIVAILAVVTFQRVSWEKTPVFSIYERVVSIADPWGQGSYRGSETFDKGDNNVFRAVWWRAVIDEAVEHNPYVGLGFGHDLAARFVRVYYPDGSEEFTVRSPHNVLVTLFGRTGAVGLGVFLLAVAVMAVRTCRAFRADPAQAAPWGIVWIIFTSACLGVVLEGPMGAVVFWTMLGVANARDSATEPVADQEEFASEAVPPLPAPATRPDTAPAT